MPARLILGIDPGSLATGWGVLSCEGSRLKAVSCGVIRPKEKVFNRRLLEIHESLTKVIAAHSPAEAAVESLFFQKNAQSALKLGHVRGVAVLACLQGGLAVREYAPAEVKQALTGHGRAEKKQVARMIQILLGFPKPPPSDAADALAVAVTHAHAGPAVLRERLKGRAFGLAVRRPWR